MDTRKRVAIGAILYIIGGIFVVIFLPLQPDGHLLSPELIAVDGIEIREGNVEITKNPPPAISKVVVEELEAAFGASNMLMKARDNSDASIQDLYGKAWTRLSSMDCMTTESLAPLRQYIAARSTAIDRVYHLYSSSDSDTFLGTNASHYFLGSVLMDAILSVDKGEYYNALERILFVIEKIGSLRYTPGNNSFHFRYDTELIKHCIRFFVLTDLLAKLNSEEIFGFVGVLHGFRDSSSGDDWRIRSKQSILQLALNSTVAEYEGPNSIHSPLFGGNFTWLYKGDSLLSRWYVRRELRNANDILDGRRCPALPVLSGAYSRLALNERELMHKGSTHYRLLLISVQLVGLVEAFYNERGRHPRNFEELELYMRDSVGTYGAPNICEGIGEYWKVQDYWAKLDSFYLEIREVPSKCFREGDLVSVNFARCSD